MKFGTLFLCVFMIGARPIKSQNTDEIVWEADWNAEILIDFENGVVPFEEPGIIFPGFTFDDTIHALGLAWQANSIQEVVGLGCINLGPLVYNLTGIEDVKEVCNHILFSLQYGLVSDINANCLDLWDELDIGHTENSTLFEMTLCYTNFTHEESPGALEAAIEVMAGVYSSCDGYGLGTDRLSVIIVWVLDSIGSPVLSFIFQINEYIAPYMGCNTLRYLLSMEIDDIKDAIIDLITYPVADVLEYLRDLQICIKLGNNEDHSEGFNFILGTLQALSGKSRSSLCSFFEGSLTRSEFKEEAKAIINNAYSLITDKSICDDVMTLLADSSEIAFVLNIATGQDITVSSNIDSLCDDIVEAVVNGASTNPGKYSLPNNVNLSEYEFLSNPGELLPDFYYTDALTLVGAVLTAGTVNQAATVFCDVFEEFLVDNFLEEVEMDVAEICNLLKNDDLEGIEQICLSQIGFPDDYPLSLRMMDPLAVTVNMARKLLDAESFSRVSICNALDTFFHSDHNLRSLASFALSDYIREAIPIVDGICENYDEIMCFLKPNCSITESSEVEETSDQTEDQEEFDEILEDVEALLLALLGYSTRSAFCSDISDGIDTLSGRASDDIVDEMVSRILSNLDDTSACTGLIEDVITGIADQVDAIEDEDIQQLMYQVTGHNDTAEVCEIVAENFPSYGIHSSEYSFLITMLGLFLTLWTNF